MAFKGTKFMCIDNTGVKMVKCIQVYDSYLVKPGSILLVTIKKVLPFKKLKKGQLYKALVVRLCFYRREFGVIIKYLKNCIVLLKKTELVPIGTRIKGSVMFEIRLKGFMKVVLLSQFLI